MTDLPLHFCLANLSELISSQPLLKSPVLGGI